MRLEFHPAAVAEMVEAAEYYDQQKPRLGREFEIVVETAIAKILDSPEAWARRFGDVRRYPLKRFPYGICYRMSGDLVTVVAVMHLRRRPGYWSGRL